MQLGTSPGCMYHRAQNRLQSHKVFRCAPEDLTPPPQSNAKSTSRKGQAIYLCCAGADVRAEGRSKSMWKEQGNCFLKVFIYSLHSAQTWSYFLFLEIGQDPLLCLALGKPKGKTLVMGSRARGLQKAQLESLLQSCSAVWSHKG